MVIDFLQLLCLGSTLRSCDRRCCRALILVHVPLQVGMWPTVSLWSTVITLQKREKKKWSVTCNFPVLYGSEHRGYVCFSFHGGKNTWLFAFVGNYMRLSSPTAVRPPWVQSAYGLPSSVNKTAWKWKALPSLHSSPDVSWLEVGTDLLRGFVSRFSASPAITAVFL